MSYVMTITSTDVSADECACCGLYDPVFQILQNEEQQLQQKRFGLIVGHSLLTVLQYTRLLLNVNAVVNTINGSRNTVKKHKSCK